MDLASQSLPAHVKYNTLGLPEPSRHVKYYTLRLPEPSGQVKISLGSTITNNLKPGRYSYDVLLKDSSNLKTRIVEGSALVTAGVTTT